MTMTKEKAVPVLIAPDPLPTLVASISEDQEILLYNFSHCKKYAFFPSPRKEKDYKTDFSGVFFISVFFCCFSCDKYLFRNTGNTEL